MLTAKQAKFVNAYNACGNGVQAAKIAGFSPKNLAPQASRLLKNANVLAEISQFKAIKRQELTKDSYIDKAMGVFEGGEFKEEPSRVRGLELAGKALGYVGSTDNKPVTTNNVQINITDSTPQIDVWAMTRKLLGND